MSARAPVALPVWAKPSVASPFSFFKLGITSSVISCAQEKKGKTRGKEKV